MGSSIVKSNLIDELLQEVKRLENEFSEMLLTKKNLEQNLYIFKLEYDSKISPFYLQKLKIDLQINEILKKRWIPLDRFKDKDSYNPEIVDEETFDTKKDYFENQEVEKGKIEFNIKSMSEEDLIDMKKLYKKLAMKFHPDKFNGQSEQKDKALELMKKINQAFQEQDFDKLKRIAAEGLEIQEIENQLDENVLITKKNELENNIESLRIEIVQIWKSGLFQLYKSYMELWNDNFYERIIEKTKKDIKEANNLLSILKEMPIQWVKMK